LAGEDGPHQRDRAEAGRHVRVRCDEERAADPSHPRPPRRAGEQPDRVVDDGRAHEAAEEPCELAVDPGLQRQDGSGRDGEGEQDDEHGDVFARGRSFPGALPAKPG
jgi:hypothetical protein